MKGIYKFFYVDNHIIEGIFVENSNMIYSMLGKYVDGKYIDVGVLTLITEDPEAVRIFELYNLETGYNPVNYI